MNAFNQMLLRLGLGVLQEPRPPHAPPCPLHWKKRMVPVGRLHEHQDLIDEFRYWRKQWYVKPVIEQPSNPKSRLLPAGAAMLTFTEEKPEKASTLSGPKGNTKCQ